jgi:uncharacterized protein YciI
MKYFIVEITYRVPWQQMEVEIIEHRKLLDEGIADGWVLAAGPREPRIGGIAIVKANSMDKLVKFFANGPYIQKGLADYIFTEFKPLKMQPEFIRWQERM